MIKEKGELINNWTSELRISKEYIIKRRIISR